MNIKKLTKMKVSVIIPAGGIGKRFGGSTPKQFHEIDGKAIIIHTLRRFLDAGIKNIIVSIHPVWKDYFVSLIREEEIDIYIRIVEGGKERQDSIINALELIAEDDEIILVHDAVRPFISDDLINNIIKNALEFGAAIPASPLLETIKQIGEDGFVVKTHDREKLVSVQTPQGFRSEILTDAYKKAIESGFIGTDDASLVEEAGHPVKVIEGESGNIKITVREDVE
jgi:2-C-methyl-D-erythritol 4-phosphate cytidylyltransferase